MVHTETFRQVGLRELVLKEVWSRRASQCQAVVAGLPMSSMSREKRGKQIQEIGLAIDRKLNPGSRFSFMKGNSGTANAPADWAVLAWSLAKASAFATLELQRRYMVTT